MKPCVCSSKPGKFSFPFPGAFHENSMGGRRGGGGDGGDSGGGGDGDGGDNLGGGRVRVMVMECFFWEYCKNVSYLAVRVVLGDKRGVVGDGCMRTDLRDQSMINQSINGRLESNLILGKRFIILQCILYRNC